MPDGLTEKQKRFCEEFLKDFNQSAAYKRTGYRCSDAAARSGAARLLANANIQAYLSSVRAEVGNNTKVTLERTVEEIAKVAFSNITNTLTFDSEGVRFRDSDTLPDEVTAAIASVGSTETTKTFHDTTETKITYKLSMHNKVSALTLLADFFGIRDDFNKARATLKRYGLLLIEDAESTTGWRLGRINNSADAPVDTDAAADELFTEVNSDTDT